MQQDGQRAGERHAAIAERMDGDRRPGRLRSRVDRRVTAPAERLCGTAEHQHLGRILMVSNYGNSLRASTPPIFTTG
jgi:hypothetical protein